MPNYTAWFTRELLRGPDIVRSMRKRIAILALSGLTMLAACSSEPEQSNAAPAEGTADAGSVVPSPASPANGEGESGKPVLGLEGLGVLKIGEPVPEGSDWAARGAQASDMCTIVNSPSWPGVYAIVEKGAVQRVTASKGSTVKLAEGIGVGASEAEARQWFAGFNEAPHVYEAAPAKYLTAPNAARGEPALRLEIDDKSKVSAIHVGLMPVLAYVEGCA